MFRFFILQLVFKGKFEFISCFLSVFRYIEVEDQVYLFFLLIQGFMRVQWEVNVGKCSIMIEGRNGYIRRCTVRRWRRCVGGSVLVMLIVIWRASWVFFMLRRFFLEIVRMWWVFCVLMWLGNFVCGLFFQVRCNFFIGKSMGGQVIWLLFYIVILDFQLGVFVYFLVVFVYGQ